MFALNQQLPILLELNRYMRQARTLPDIAGLAVHYLHQLVNCPHIAIVLFNFEMHEAIVLAAQEPLTGLTSEEAMPLAQFSVPPVLLQGQPHLELDLRTKEGLTAVEQQLLLASLFTYAQIPLIFQGDLMGVILLAAPASVPFQPETMATIFEVADQVAVAMRQVRLHEAMEQHLGELTMLHAVARSGANVRQERELFERVTQLIRSRLYADYFQIFLLDKGLGVLRAFDGAETVPLMGSLEGWVVANGRLRRITDTHNELAYAHSQPNIRSRLVMPLKAGQRIMGVLSVGSRRPNAVGEADVWVLATLAQQLTTALVRLRAEASERQREQQITALNLIGQSITASLNLREVLQRIVDAIPQLVNAEGGAVLLREQEELMFAAVSGVGVHGLERVRMPVYAGAAGQVMRTSRPMLIDSETASSQIDASMHEFTTYQTRSLIAAPLKIGNDVIGVLEAVHQRPGAFSVEDMQALEGAAAWVSIAVENARLHEQVQRHAVELEERVEERTLALKEMNEELEQYAYAVSHDLRTPLRGIRNYADFLHEDLEDIVDEELARYLDGLVRAVREADQMVDGLLTLSRIGRRDLPLEWLDVGVFMRGLLTSLELPEDVVVNMADEWPTMQTEVALMRQIFQNLILNGVKFNRAQPKIIALSWSLADGQFYQFQVRDNGIGIDPAYQDRIFGVFERLHTYQEYSGTGIGLAIVKKAVRRLRGTIRVDSKLAQGSTFIIILPVN